MTGKIKQLDMIRYFLGESLEKKSFHEKYEIREIERKLEF